ncbi:hypothetical protein ACROYT_G005415 [Oculina patagonica]
MGYKEAWERLHSEYGQNKLVINAHEDEIAHLPVLRGTNYAKIQELYENESKKFDALLMLGEADMLQGFAMSTLNNSHMLTPNRHGTRQMITLNGTKQQSMPVFPITMDSLDGKTRERIEVTGSKMPEFATTRPPNMNDLKLKYERARDRTFYVKLGDE